MIIEPVSFTKNLDIISIIYMVIAVVILCFSFYKKEGTLLETISKTVAKNEKISLIFSIVMSFGIPMYYGSVLLYLSPKYKMSLMFNVLLMLALTLEMLFIWCPARGKTAKLHTRSALTVAIVMVFEMLLIALFGYNVNIVLKSIAVIYFVLCVLLGIMLVANKKVQQKSFLLQSAFLFLFVIIFMLLQHF